MEPVKTVQRSTAKKKAPEQKRRFFGADFKLQIVKKHLEESVPVSVICQECGVGTGTVGRWVRAYRSEGEAGLAKSHNGKGRSLPAPVKQKIVEIKEANPPFGIKRISQLLKRMFFLSASPETVRKTLHESSLMTPPPKKRQRNMTRPRFFERSTPNQLWQTDIFTFRLGGRYAFLIGYIDDYSRYITGLELFRSQTAQNVIEVYRRAASEYNPPKEMLTDNGRQYTSWRGNSRFELELKKDRIRHIKSQPHHPMTLGKIERFWKTIYLEFLSRAQFESFEDAGERIRQWVKYYNHKRPHQGIGGLCPADRYFEIQSELRKTIEQGIQDNLLEMALRGKPRLPFYMVGRMEGQSVVLRAEKGRLRLSVEAESDDITQEVVYNLNEKGDDHGEDGEDKGREEAADAELRGDGEVPGGAVGMDGEEETRGDMPGAVDPLDGACAVAEAGDGGNAAGTGVEGEPGQRAGALSTASGDVGEEETDAPDEYGSGQAGEDAVEGAGGKESRAGSVEGHETRRPCLAENG
ncbi:MAG TPA: DDE-type integrase/transposase/recombinase [Thermodesulfovibrionales bacterium]|nr:DDE-type integrase/transposase/recombinase [Thermodesulfovibrionales bacterium]